MATKYFVTADTGIGSNHNWNNTNNWSLSSGGAGGAGVPTQDDDVVIDQNSNGHILPIENSVYITNGYTAKCRNLSINVGFSFKIAFINNNPNLVNSGIEIYGTLNIYGTPENPVLINVADVAYQKFYLFGDLGTLNNVRAYKILSAQGHRIYYNPDFNVIVSECPYWVKPTPPAWYAGVLYAVGDYITQDTTFYQCVVAHISTAFELQSAFWETRDNETLMGRLNIRISDKRQMSDMYNAPDYSYTLANDIDMDGQTWVPVGGGYLPNPGGGLFNIPLNPFTGNFDGQGFTISNLVYDDTIPDTTRAGMFGLMGATSNASVAYETPTIHDLTIDSFVITGPLAGLLCGGIFTGILKNLNFVDCSLEVTGNGGGSVSEFMFNSTNVSSIAQNINVTRVAINGSEELGLLFGYSEGIIKDCNVQGSIYGDEDLGGLCGVSEDAMISNCTANCTFDFPDAFRYIGGFCGEDFDSTFFNCSSQIIIDSAYDDCFYVGGFVGSSEGTSINKCFTYGSILLTGTNNSLSHIGGFFGESYLSNFINCYSRTSVIAANYSIVGGFIGFVSHDPDGSLQNCYAAGDVTGNDSVGGFVGEYDIEKNIINCYSVGIVTGNTKTGGLIGYCKSGLLLTNCAWYTAAADNVIGDDGDGSPRTLLFPDLGTDEPDNTKFYEKTHQVYQNVPQTFINDDSGNAIQDDTGHYVEGV